MGTHASLKVLGLHAALWLSSQQNVLTGFSSWSGFRACLQVDVLSPTILTSVSVIALQAFNCRRRLTGLRCLVLLTFESRLLRTRCVSQSWRRELDFMRGNALIRAVSAAKSSLNWSVVRTVRTSWQLFEVGVAEAREDFALVI